MTEMIETRASKLKNKQDFQVITHNNYNPKNKNNLVSHLFNYSYLSIS